MKQLTSAEFRRDYTHADKPIEVTAWGKVIGTWYPAGTEPDAPAEVVANDAAPRMTIRPALGPRKVMTGETRRIIDPSELRRVAVANEAARLEAKTNRR